MRDRDGDNFEAKRQVEQAKRTHLLAFAFVFKRGNLLGLSVGVILEEVQTVVNLLGQDSFVAQELNETFDVVAVEQHTSNFTSELCIFVCLLQVLQDEGVQSFTQHDTLLFGTVAGQLSSGETLFVSRGRSSLRLLRLLSGNDGGVCSGLALRLALRLTLVVARTTRTTDVRTTTTAGGHTTATTATTALTTHLTLRHNAARAHSVVGHLGETLTTPTRAGHHTRLTRVRDEALRHGTRRVEHAGATRVTHGGTTGHVGAHTASTGSMLLHQLETALFLRLVQVDIQRLLAARENATVHLGQSALSLFGGSEADKAEALGDALLVGHHADGLDLAEVGEFLSEGLFVDFIFQVLNIQVDASVLGQMFELELLVLSAQLAFALRLLLCATDVQGLVVDLVAVHLVDATNCVFVVLEVDKAELAALSVSGDEDGSDLAKILEHFGQTFLGHFAVEILHENVGP